MWMFERRVSERRKEEEEEEKGGRKRGKRRSFYVLWPFLFNTGDITLTQQLSVTAHLEGENVTECDGA